MINDLNLNLKFWNLLKEDPILVINNSEFRNHPKFLKFNCIAIRRILEMQLCPLEELKRIIGMVELEMQATTLIDTHIHECRDQVSKDIVRERKRKLQILEVKIKQSQETGIMKNINFVALQEIAQEEFEQELSPNHLEVNKADIPYYSMLSQYEFLSATCESLILQKKHGLAKNRGAQQFFDFFLVDLEELNLIAREYKEFIRAEKQRIRQEKFKEKNQGRVDAKRQETMQEQEFLDGEVVELPDDPIIEDIGRALQLYTKAGQFAMVSKLWNQLDNIVRGAWNLMIYQLTSPINFERSGVYQDIILMANQILVLLQNYNKNEDQHIHGITFWIIL